MTKHPLHIHILATLRHWSARPLTAIALCWMVTLLAFSGPVACLVHCWSLDVSHQHTHHEHDHHADAHVSAGAVVDPHDVCEHGITETAMCTPSALTVATILPLNLLPRLFATTFERPRHLVAIDAVAFPPPRYPPRVS